MGRYTAKNVSPSIRRVKITAQTVEDPLSLSEMFEVSENAVIQSYIYISDIDCTLFIASLSYR